MLSTTSSLVVGIQDMDQDRWRTFIKLYTPLLSFWIRSKGVPGSAHDDVLQEVLRSVFNGIGDFQRDAGMGTFRGWLRTITSRRIADFFRRFETMLKTESADFAVIPEKLRAENDFAKEEQEFLALKARAMEIARQTVAENTWNMFWQSVVEGRETREVAEDYGVSTAAVRMARARVIKRLRDLLSGFDNPDSQ